MNEAKYERLKEEKAMLVKAFNNPAVQMIFMKLKDSAMKSLVDYDVCDFDTEKGREMAHRIQARRYVILNELPRIVDEIINVDLELVEGVKQWQFNRWIEGIRDYVKGFFTSANTEAMYSRKAE